MITEKMREDFEREWNKVSGRIPERSIAMDGQNSYENRIDDAAWWAWQASRAAIEVVLPSPNNDYSYSDRGIADACEHHRRAILAIESLGLKVKP